MVFYYARYICRTTVTINNHIIYLLHNPENVKASKTWEIPQKYVSVYGFFTLLYFYVLLILLKFGLGSVS
jgi:hypothetical protein